MKWSPCTLISSPFILLFTLYAMAQPGLKYAKLGFTNDSSKFAYKMHAILEDSLLVTIPLNYSKLKKSITVPIDRIAFIKTAQGVSHGKGALKGMLKGAILGLTLGLLFDLSDDGPLGTYHQSSQSPIPITMAVFTPLAGLIGWGAGSRKYKTYTINGNLEAYREQWPEMLKDLETDPHISISKFKERRNNPDHR